MYKRSQNLATGSEEASPTVVSLALVPGLWSKLCLHLVHEPHISHYLQFNRITE